MPLPLVVPCGALDALPCKGDGLEPIASRFPGRTLRNCRRSLVDALKGGVDFPQPRTRVLEQADRRFLAGIVGAEFRPVFDWDVGQVVHGLPVGLMKRLVRQGVDVALEVPLQFQQLMPKSFHFIFFHPMPHLNRGGCLIQCSSDYGLSVIWLLWPSEAGLKSLPGDVHALLWAP